MLTRRRLIQLAGVVGGFVVGQRITGISGAVAETPGPGLPGVGEPYGGFLILPWGSTAPPPQRRSSIRVPATEGPDGSHAVYQTVADPLLTQRLAFPFYAFGAAGTEGARFDDSVVFGNDVGQVVSVSRTGWIFDADKNAEVDALNLIAVRNVPTPVPIWPGGHPQVGLLNYQKVDWSPRPGLLSRSGWSDHLAWIEDDTRYSLEVKLRYVHSSIKDIAESLVRLV